MKMPEVMERKPEEQKAPLMRTIITESGQKKVVEEVKKRQLQQEQAQVKVNQEKEEEYEEEEEVK